MQNIEEVKNQLLEKIAASDVPRDILKLPEFKKLYSVITTLPNEQRGEYGRQVNELRVLLERQVEIRESELEDATIQPIDVTAPWDVNTGEYLGL